ncbi:MAG: NAD(+) synthase, partial [Myxococcales bacterium]|nr:NAD(+) synthase [Myxococcales bacterium]
IPIEPAMKAFGGMFREAFTHHPEDETEENVQARARGLTLMALSNKLGHMVLSTGNKSEMSVGYATLYGDMCGGYSVLKDIYKTTVFALSRWRNEHRPEGGLGPEGRVIPERVITKPPSAELKPDQTDQDTLPPYDVLDAILKRYEERLETVDQIVAAGFERAVVRDVVRKIQVNEYKRQQAAPGLKVTSRAFGFGRRMPIAARLNS